ncbi:MAG: hypothetical protein N2Z76_01355 [Treponemataceae bacterium]|nr:hypothetical protein [Treponemataceae bacterium]
MLFKGISFGVWISILAVSLPSQETVSNRQFRSFSELYPVVSKEASLLKEASSEGGLLRVIEEKPTKERLHYLPSTNPPFPWERIGQKRNVTFFVEALRLVPYSAEPAGKTKDASGPMTPPSLVSPEMLRIYGALSKIRALSGRLYHSHSRNRDIPLFEEVTRIDSLRSQKALADPTEISSLPGRETVLIKLKDANFGICFYQAELEQWDRGLLYSLTNARSLTYGIIPIIGEQKFIAQIYLEPLTEGTLMYALAGSEVPSLIASQVHMPSAIEKRLNVIIQWLVDGLR